jgi:hypothetical protein
MKTNMAVIIDFQSRFDRLDPQVLTNVCKAYDQAVTVLNANRLSPPSDLLAQRLLTFARSGVTDHKRLCQVALDGLLIQQG